MTGFELLDVDSDHLLVAIHGRLDLEGVQAIGNPLTIKVTAARKPTILDLSDVPFLASLAMGMIVQIYRGLLLHGAPLVLMAPQPLVAEAFRNASLDGAIPIEPDLTAALRWVRAFAEAQTLDDRPAYGVSLVAEEILANIVQYGGPRGPIRLRVSRDDAGLTLRFEDDGSPFDPTSPRAPALPPSPGGRGLALVQRTARSLSYRRDGERNLRVVEIDPGR